MRKSENSTVPASCIDTCRRKEICFRRLYTTEADIVRWMYA